MSQQVVVSPASVGVEHYLQAEVHRNKQVEVYAVQENDEWLVITIITRYF